MKEWAEQTIPGMIAKSASRWGERTAIITDDGERLTYGEFYARICDLAAGFHALGIRAGDHVATLTGTQPLYLVASHALLMLRAVVVPVNFNFQPDEMAFVLRQSDAKFLVMEDEIGGMDCMERMRKILPGTRAQQDFHLRCPALPELKAILVHSPSGRIYPGTLPMDKVRSEGMGRGRSMSDRFLSQVQAEDIAFVLYTSGTTAFPKGALRTHASSLGIAHYITVNAARLTEQDVALVYSPFFHIGGCVYNGLGPHMCGATMVLMKSFDPGRALELIEEHRVTFLSGFETHFHRLTRHPHFDSTDVSSVTKIRLATGPHWYDRLRELGMGREILAHHYGFTEGTGVVMPPEEEDEEIRRNANGRPFPGVELKIVDPETGKQQPTGVAGEICLKGWTLFRWVLQDA